MDGDHLLSRVRLHNTLSRSRLLRHARRRPVHSTRVLDASHRSQMPGPFRDTKVTDFFQRQPSLLRIGNDPFHTSSQLSAPALPRSAPKGNPNPSQPVPVKRKPGRPKGSGKKAKQNHNRSILVSLDPPFHPGGSSAPLLSSGSPLPRPGTSSKRQPRKPKNGRNKTENNNEEPRFLRSSRGPALRGSRNTIPPLDTASQHRPRVLYNSPKENTSSQASVPSKRKLDDDDETASITSSGVPLSLYCILRQTSSPSLSKPPEPPLTTDNFSPPQTKKRRSLASPAPRSLQAPVTPKSARGKEIVPTSRSSEAGLYSPIRPNLISQRRNDVQESVENWRHGRSAYRCNIVSPPRFCPGVDYSMEVDRPPSPLTSYLNSTSLGSPLSSFPDADAIPLDVDLERPPSPLAQHSLPTPSSSEGQVHGSPMQIVKPLPVRPVTPPPSSPEQEPVPVAPKDSKARTAEILAEIWANVRAKSVLDSEDSYLHVPINDELSSEEEDDEPFWKRTKTPAR
jgi:hypothetical protein